MKLITQESELEGLTPGTKQTAKAALEQGKKVLLCTPEDDIPKVIAEIRRILK